MKVVISGTPKEIDDLLHSVENPPPARERDGRKAGESL